MSAPFVNIDRRTPLLLPPDLRDWVPDHDLVHFVVEAIEGMDLRNFRVNHRGSGSRQYPPGMMLAGLLPKSIIQGSTQRLGIDQMSIKEEGTG